MDNLHLRLLMQLNAIRDSLGKAESGSRCTWSIGEALNSIREEVIALHDPAGQDLIKRLVRPIEVRINHDGPYTVHSQDARRLCEQLIAFLVEPHRESIQQDGAANAIMSSKIQDEERRKRGILLWDMTTYFDSNELENICFIMGIDYQSLRGDEKMSKAREIILYCERSQRMAELLEVCRKLRPNVSW